MQVSACRELGLSSPRNRTSGLGNGHVPSVTRLYFDSILPDGNRNALESKSFVLGTGVDQTTRALEIGDVGAKLGDQLLLRPRHSAM